MAAWQTGVGVADPQVTQVRAIFAGSRTAVNPQFDERAVPDGVAAARMAQRGRRRTRYVAASNAALGANGERHQGRAASPRRGDHPRGGLRMQSPVAGQLDQTPSVSGQGRIEVFERFLRRSASVPLSSRPVRRE